MFPCSCLIVSQQECLACRVLPPLHLLLCLCGFAQQRPPPPPPLFPPSPPPRLTFQLFHIWKVCYVTADRNHLRGLYVEKRFTFCRLRSTPKAEEPAAAPCDSWSVLWKVWSGWEPQWGRRRVGGEPLQLTLRGGEMSCSQPWIHFELDSNYVETHKEQETLQLEMKHFPLVQNIFFLYKRIWGKKTQQTFSFPISYFYLHSMFSNCWKQLNESFQVLTPWAGQAPNHYFDCTSGKTPKLQARINSSGLFFPPLCLMPRSFFFQPFHYSRGATPSENVQVQTYEIASLSLAQVRVSARAQGGKR